MVYCHIMSFSCNIAVWFWYQDNSGLIKQCVKCSLFYVLEDFGRGCIIFSLNVQENFPVKTSAHGDSVVGKFLTTNSIYLISIALLKLSTSFWVNFGSLHLSRNLSSLSLLSNLRTCYYYFLYSLITLLICIGSTEVSFFRTNSFSLCLLSFLLDTRKNRLEIY